MSTTPTTFTIQNTGIYRMVDDSAAYWFEAGTIIPMYLAIALGIEGAGYDPVPVFDAAQVAAIEALVAEGGGGGGGGASFPMAEGVWYDNRTAVGGILSEGGAELDADTVSVAVVRVSDPSCSITSLMLNISGGPSGAATMRAAVYEIGAGLALGDRIGAEHTVSVDESETGYKTIALDVPTPPGYYAIAISATEYMEIHGISGSWDGTTPIGSTILGTTTDPALQIDSFTGYSASATGAHTALPSSLSSVTASDLNPNAPFVYFQITHD